MYSSDKIKKKAAFLFELFVVVQNKCYTKSRWKIKACDAAVWNNIQLNVLKSKHAKLRIYYNIYTVRSVADTMLFKINNINMTQKDNLQRFKTRENCFGVSLLWDIKASEVPSKDGVSACINMKTMPYLNISRHESVRWFHILVPSVEKFMSSFLLSLFNGSFEDCGSKINTFADSEITTVLISYTCKCL